MGTDIFILMCIFILMFKSLNGPHNCILLKFNLLKVD